MSGWDYTDTYVAACGRCFSNYVQGRQHERYCDYCQRAIRGEEQEEEDDDDRTND